MKEHLTSKHIETMISVRGLHKSFDELQVLKGIDLELNKGENVVVLGRSGSGKSVLMKIIVGLIPADEGSVEVLGKQVTHLKGKELDALRLHVGYSFQNSALYDSMNVRQNLEFPLKMNNKKLSQSEIAKAVEEVLDAVDLKDKLKSSRKIAGIPHYLSSHTTVRTGLVYGGSLNIKT